jgi:peptidoglycan/LPS O-acetylase OafA/YrhL
MRLRELDGWRAISVCFVILGHLLTFSSVAPQDAVIRSLSLDTASFGVRVFFVISGFVIVRGLLSESANGQISILAFYVRRCFRILPPLLLYVLAMMALAWSDLIPSDALGVFRALFFACNVKVVDCGGWFGAHTWSLAVEEQFYLVVPVALALLPVTRRWLLVLIAAVLPVVAIGLYAVGHPLVGKFVSPFVAISVGAAMAVYEHSLRTWSARLPGMLIVASAGLALVPWLLPASAPGTAMKIVSPIFMAIVLLWTISMEGRVSHVLTSRPLQVVGVASYGVYLWQQLATYAFPDAGWPFYAFSIPACFGLAILLFRFMERPLIEIGRSWSRAIKRGPLRSQASATTG